MPNFALRICSLATIFCLLAGCGFHTVYGSHRSGDDSSVSLALNQIAVDNIPDRQGQILRNELIDKMYGKGRPAQPLYTLTIKLKRSEEDIGVLLDSTSTRTLVNTYADYDLKDLKGNVVLHGHAHSTTSFSKLNDQYATLAADEDAMQRTVDEVSEQIVNRLSLYFSEHQ